MTALRLFFAVPVASAAVPSLNTFHTQQHEQHGWRWPHKSSWHITVAFLGAVDSALLPMLLELGQNATTATEAGTLDLTQLEWWPTARRPRLLVATGATTPSLTHLHQCLSDGLRQHQLPCDERPLHPHVTLARLQRSATLLESLPSCTETVAIDRLALYRSDAGPRGSTYNIIWQQSLGQ